MPLPSPEKPYDLSGEDVGPLYHAGDSKITGIDPNRLQSRDSGFYGSGFYAARSPQAVKGYGNRITKFSLSPNARVLSSSLNPSEAHPQLISDVKKHALQSGLERARARGKEDALRWEVENIDKSPISWKSAVDRYASDNGYDAIQHSPSEFVVKNHSKARFNKAVGGGISTPIGNTGISIDPSKAARTALLVAKNTGRLHFDAGGQALKQAINNFSQARNAEFDGSRAPASADTKLLQAMLWPQQHQLAVAEAPQQRPQPVAQNMGDLGDEIERGAKFLKGEPADDDDRPVAGQPSKEAVVNAATGHQNGNAPPVVSGVHMRGVQNGNAPPLITTKSYGTPAAGLPMSGDGSSSPNPNYHYASLNNPGNIGFGDWAQKHGAVTHAGWDTGHAIAGFPDLDTGYRAMATLAGNKYNAGALTLNDLIAGRNGWTPGNKVAASNIAKYMGISPKDDLNLNDPTSMANFQRALTMQETGSSAQWDAYNTPRNPPQRAAQEQPAPVLTEPLPPAQVPEPQAAPPSQPNNTSAGPQAMADPMSDMYDRIAFSPDVQAGYDNPQVMFDPNAALSAARGGKIRRASGGPAYASMPTNELIDKALNIIRRRRAASGGTQTSSVGNFILNHPQQALNMQNEDAALYSGMGMGGGQAAGRGNANSNESQAQQLIDATNGLWQQQLRDAASADQPSPSQPAPAPTNTPAVTSGTVGNQGAPSGAPLGAPPSTGPTSYSPPQAGVTGPTSPIPMASPTGFNGYNYNNSLDEVLGTNAPTSNQVFGFDYPQNLPAPKPQPVGPVSQDEINALYGYGGGVAGQMGTGTYNSGGAVLMDALNRARKDRRGGGRLSANDMAALMHNLPNDDGSHPGYYNDGAKNPADYAPIPSDSRIGGYDRLFNNPPQPDADWSARDSDYRSYPILNQQAIRRGGAVKGKR